MKQTNFQPSNGLRSRKKVIKRYGNRKLYDTEQSSYVVLNDIAKMIRNKEEVQIIDNDTNHDITLPTLTQIIFGAEKKTRVSAPAEILKSIICAGDGSFSSFLSKMGLFKSGGRSHKQAGASFSNKGSVKVRNQKKETSALNQKVASMAVSYKARPASSRHKEEFVPRLPGGSHLK